MESQQESENTAKENTTNDKKRQPLYDNMVVDFFDPFETPFTVDLEAGFKYVRKKMQECYELDPDQKIIFGLSRDSNNKIFIEVRILRIKEGEEWKL